MGVEQRAKAVDEDHGAEAGRGAGIRAALPKQPLYGGGEDVQRDVLHRRVALQVIAQAFGGSVALTHARPIQLN